MTNQIEECILEYQRTRHRLAAFQASVSKFFSDHPLLNEGSLPVLHSIRARMKDEDHLRDKLRRKEADGKTVSPSNLLHDINDLAGVRLLHLYPQQFGKIHEVIMEQVASDEWALHEAPVAYTWDPDSVQYFTSLNLTTKLKESSYTSIHYLIKPRRDSAICCELQVRTLFEEIWGEVDHSINYPHKTTSLSCREQISVLSRLVGAGSRLTDSIYRAYAQHQADGAVTEKKLT